MGSSTYTLIFSNYQAIFSVYKFLKYLFFRLNLLEQHKHRKAGY